jgi:hypothetical protein
MKYHAVLTIALASLALACAGNKTSESTGDVVPLSDSATVPADTITTHTRDDTLNQQRDTSVIRDTTPVFRDTTASVYGDTAMRDTSALPPDTSR